MGRNSFWAKIFTGGSNQQGLKTKKVYHCLTTMKMFFHFEAIVFNYPAKITFM